MLARITGNGGDFTPSELASWPRTSSARRPRSRVPSAGSPSWVPRKDLDSGLLDFPGTRPSGEPILLCWRLGEDEIAWWHTEQDGFGGRRPLEEL